jgi:hypothetical protein
MSGVSGSNRCKLFASGLEDRCSTTELTPHILVDWLKGGSLRISDYRIVYRESYTSKYLSIEAGLATLPQMVRRVGFEPTVGLRRRIMSPVLSTD